MDIDKAKAAAGAIKDAADPIVKVTSATSKTSLTRLTKDQIFQFPIIMDADINDDEKFPIIKSLEKNYAALILTAIINEGYIDRGKFGQTNKFLRRFHNNTDLPFDSLESFTVADAVATEGYLPKSDLEEMWDCAEEQLDTTCINDMYLPYRKTLAKLNRALESAKFSRAMEGSEDEKKYFKRVRYRKGKNGENVKMDGKPIIDTDKSGNPIYDYFEAPDSNTAKYKDMVSKYGEPVSAAEIGPEFQRSLNEKLTNERQEERERARVEQRMKVDAAKGIRGEVVKDDKFNSLTPTLLKMSLANFKEGATWSQELIIGVRAMPRMLSQSVIISNMVEAFKDRAIFKFIKWTRGELKWTDLFFGINTAREEASMKADRKWLKVLRKRARRNNIGRIGGFKLNPNCTIIITEADAHMIQERCGVNPHDITNVRKMMDKYFLLAFGIYDTEAKMLNIIYDGENDFSTYSLRTLMAEAKKESNLMQMNRY